MGLSCMGLGVWNFCACIQGPKHLGGAPFIRIFKDVYTMKCTPWTKTQKVWRLKVPNSRFALHSLAPPKFTVCALFLPLAYGLCAFFRPLLTHLSRLSTAPFVAGWLRNRKPEPSEPFFPKPKAEPEPPEPFSRNWNRNRPFLWKCTETQKTLFAEEPPEPKTGTAWTVPSPNHNQTEPNRGLPVFARFSVHGLRFRVYARAPSKKSELKHQVFVTISFCILAAWTQRGRKQAQEICEPIWMCILSFKKIHAWTICRHVVFGSPLSNRHLTNVLKEDWRAELDACFQLSCVVALTEPKHLAWQRREQLCNNLASRKLQSQENWCVFNSQVLLQVLQKNRKHENRSSVSAFSKSQRFQDAKRNKVPCSHMSVMIWQPEPQYSNRREEYAKDRVTSTFQRPVTSPVLHCKAFCLHPGLQQYSDNNWWCYPCGLVSPPWPIPMATAMFDLATGGGGVERFYHVQAKLLWTLHYWWVHLLSVVSSAVARHAEVSWFLQKSLKCQEDKICGKWDLLLGCAATSCQPYPASLPSSARLLMQVVWDNPHFVRWDSFLSAPLTQIGRGCLQLLACHVLHPLVGLSSHGGEPSALQQQQHRNLSRHVLGSFKSPAAFVKKVVSLAEKFALVIRF